MVCFSLFCETHGLRSRTFFLLLRAPILFLLLLFVCLFGLFWFIYLFLRGVHVAQAGLIFAIETR